MSSLLLDDFTGVGDDNHVDIVDVYNDEKDDEMTLVAAIVVVVVVVVA